MRTLKNSRIATLYDVCLRKKIWKFCMFYSEFAKRLFVATNIYTRWPHVRQVLSRS